MATMKKDDMKISNVQKRTNTLQIPIYCVSNPSNLSSLQMAAFRNFVIVGGGGGNEIENKLMMFDIAGQNLASNMMTKMVSEFSTGKDVANYIEMAHVSFIAFKPFHLESQCFCSMRRP